VGSVSGKGITQKATNRSNRNRKQLTNRRIHAPANTKHIGDLTELEFMLQAANRGFPVAKPFGDNEHYDILVDGRSRLWRVQVKCATPNQDHSFRVCAFWHGSHRRVHAYTPADIDFLVAYVRPSRIWYIIPVRALKQRLTIVLYPSGPRRRSNSGRFEKYREAWHLLNPKEIQVALRD
jgi:hypothetical protein